MVKANFHGGGPFDPPSGQVTVETPDGVIKTFGGSDVRSSLTNADFAYGGPDGSGYGAFPREEDDSSNALGGPPSDRRDRFRVG